MRDLVQAAGGQLRLAPTGGVVGLDRTALLAMARARGVDAAELLPHVEAVVVETLARQARSGGGDGGDV